MSERGRQNERGEWHHNKRVRGGSSILSLLLCGHPSNDHSLVRLVSTFAEVGDSGRADSTIRVKISSAGVEFILWSQCLVGRGIELNGVELSN